MTPTQYKLQKSHGQTVATKFGNCLRHMNFPPVSNSDGIITRESIAAITGGEIEHCETYIDSVLAAANFNPLLTDIFEIFLKQDPKFKITFHGNSIGLGHSEGLTHHAVIRKDLPGLVGLFAI